MKQLLIILALIVIPQVSSAALKDGMVSYWKLDESSGNAEDIHSTNDLTNNNTTPYAAAKINNGSNPSAATGASAKGLTITDASQSGLDITGDVSISVWVNPSSLSDNGIVGKYGYYNNDTDTDRSYMLYQNSDAGSSIFFFVYDSDSNAEAAWKGVGLSTDTWYHIVVTFDVDTGKANLYLNGVAQAEKTLTGISSIADRGGDFMLGRIVGAADPRSAAVILDEAGVWNRVLTSTEATLLYNGGSGLAYSAMDVPSSINPLFLINDF